MSFRIEEKLSIDSNKITDFKIFLNDKKSKRIYQTRKIRSLYFDNPNYEMYNDSIEGVVPRKKMLPQCSLMISKLRTSEDSKYQINI